MKKIVVVIVMLFSISSFSFAFTIVPNIIVAEKTIPSYAKWGKLAMKETIKKYPHAQVVDYLHAGKTKDGDKTTEKFKLWLKGNNHEFGVFVSITFNSNTEDVLKIVFEETSR